MLKVKFLTAGLFLAAVTITTGPARAVTILPGGATALSGADDITGSLPGFQLVFVQDSVSPGTFSAITRAAVYDRGGGLLDFYYQVSNDDTPQNSLGRLTMAAFDSFAVQVLYRTDAIDQFLAGQIGPAQADRGMTGDVIGLNFPACVAAGCTNPPLSKIQPGQSSYTIVLRTNAIGYLPGFIGVIDGTAGSADGFQPTGLAGEEIPEPASALMAVCGLLVIAALKRR